MTSFSPSFSARTTNPDGRCGRSPTTVLISRSGDTSTGARWQLSPAAPHAPGALGVPGRGVLLSVCARWQPPITPDDAVMAAVLKNRRRFTFILRTHISNEVCRWHCKPLLAGCSISSQRKRSAVQAHCAKAHRCHSERARYEGEVCGARKPLFSL